MEPDFFDFFAVYTHHKFGQNCRIGQKFEFFCLHNIGCGYSKLVSLDAGQCKKGISASYRRAEKTSKNCSDARILNTWLMGVAFERFLISVVTFNSFFAVTSNKKHKFRVSTTNIGKT